MRSDANEDKIELNIAGLHFTGLAQGPRDGTLVLCLHGFPQFADSYRPVLQSLAAAGYRAVSINQRGYSAGARPTRVEDYKLERLVSDIGHIATALEADRFHLVGHDWGGVLAWAYAARFPDRLLSLAVLSTPHPDALKVALSTDVTQMLKSSYILLFRTPVIAERIIKAFNWTFLRRAVRPYLSHEQTEEIISRLSEPYALTAALNWYRAVDLGSAPIGPVQVPTLFLWGSEDQALGRSAAVGTSKFMNGTYHFEVLEGASHWLLEERPDQISNDLLRHFKNKGAH